MRAIQLDVDIDAMLLMLQVYFCREGEVSQQNLTYHVLDEAFLAVLGDPVVCFADASFKQTQVSIMMIVITDHYLRLSCVHKALTLEMN